MVLSTKHKHPKTNPITNEDKPHKQLIHAHNENPDISRSNYPNEAIADQQKNTMYHPVNPSPYKYNGFHYQQVFVFQTRYYPNDKTSYQ